MYKHSFKLSISVIYINLPCLLLVTNLSQIIPNYAAILTIVKCRLLCSNHVISLPTMEWLNKTPIIHKP